MTTKTIDESFDSSDRTVRLFDNFYSEQVRVDANEFEVVSSFFKEACVNTTVAKNFTSFLFQIAANTGVSTMDLIEELRGKSRLEMNATMAYYLNSFKTKHSMYGIGVIPRPVETIQRNILN